MSRGIYDKVNKVRIPTCGNQEFDVDNALSSNSQNAVENRIINAEFNKTFRNTDSAETSLADADTFPFYDASAAEKKKTTFSNLFSKLRTSLGSMTAAQLKAGSDTTIRGMRADYAKNGIRQIISESVSNEIIETLGSKPTRAYALNEYFLANDGYYYVTTAAISTSTNITSGTNCSKTSIAAAFENLRSEVAADYINFNSSTSSISTNYGSVYSSWYAYFTVFHNYRSSAPESMTICRALDIRMSSVSSRPTVTITDDRLKRIGTFICTCMPCRYSGSTQYPCDIGTIQHNADTNVLTITANSFAATGPNGGYFTFFK